MIQANLLYRLTIAAFLVALCLLVGCDERKPRSFHPSDYNEYPYDYYYSIDWVTVRRNIDTLRICGSSDTALIVIDSLLLYPAPNRWYRAEICTTWVKP